MGYTLDANGGQQWDGKEGGGFSGNTSIAKDTSYNPNQTAYQKWVGEQTTTNSRFDPNNYQTDANGVRFTPGYSIPITTRAGFNASTPGIKPTASTGTTPNYSTQSNGSTGGGYSASSYGGTNGVSGTSSPTTTTQQTPSTPSVNDNSSLITKMYESQKADAISQLKQSIANSQSQYQTTIAQSQGQYQPLRDMVNVDRNNNMRNVSEMLANNGQQGGVNRTDTTQVNTAADQNMNNLNAKQQEIIDTANKSIADLTASGNLQEAQIVSKNATDKLQALINESNRVTDTNYTYSQDAIKNAMNAAQLTGNYNGQNTLAKQGLDQSTNQFNMNYAQNAQNNANTQANALAQLIGKTSDGTQTIAGKTADSSIALQQAQLQEITNPNSVTNQLQKLNLDTANLKYAALPAQLQAEAQQIAQDLQLGKINIQTAQTQLDYLPAISQAQINASNRSNIPTPKAPTAGEKKNSATAAFQSWANNAMSQNMPEQDAISYAYANSDILSEDGLGIDDAIKYVRNIYTQVRNPARAAAGGYMPQ